MNLEKSNKIKTIDITAGNELFQGADPVGLLPTASAREYLETLKAQVDAQFPEADVFVRWSPSKTDGADVMTLPRKESAEEKLLELATEVREEAEWLCYDESVRSAFAS